MFGLGLSLMTAAALPAQAPGGTALHTWVAGKTGRDSNPCSRALPCATIKQALYETGPGGVVSVLESGDYGQVVIGKPVTLDGTGAHVIVGGLAPGLTITVNGQLRQDMNALTVGTGLGDVVTLRHLSLSSDGNTTGLFVIGGGTVNVEDCRISGFPQAGLDLATNTGTVVVKSTTITNCPNAVGIRVGDGTANAAAPLFASFKEVTVQGTAVGILAQSGLTDISQSLITQNATAGLQAVSGATLSASGCVLSGNGTAVVSGMNSIVRLSENDLWNNGAAINANGGVVSTTGSNRRAGNATVGAAGDAPNRSIAVQ